MEKEMLVQLLSIVIATIIEYNIIKIALKDYDKEKENKK